MKRVVAFQLATLGLAALIGFRAGAQSSASISGIVVDPGGSVVPGAAVTVTEEETGVSFKTVTGPAGHYHVPSLQAGTYTVTASAPGFKTAEARDVRVALGQPVTVNLKLEVGALEQTVTVTGAVELVNSETPTVDATLLADQINEMPTPTRNALNAVTFLLGVETETTNRRSTINGLPHSYMSITLDGASASDNFLRQRDGFFALVTPRQDAVEAVTVTLAAGGAQIGGGTGAVTMAFQTRSGTNKLRGSVYHYYRNEAFNTNYYFNKVYGLPKNELKLYQYGGRIGGPVVIPGLYNGRNRTFFFVHYEQIRFPNSYTRTRTVLNSRALDGIFRYECPAGVCEVNVFNLAARNGHISEKDPTVYGILRKIEQAATITGARIPTADPLLDRYVWQSPGRLFEHQPTIRLDHNITDSHRLGGTFTFINVTRDPDYYNGEDRRFPNSSQYRKYVSTRPLISVWLRSTLSPRLINEFRAGAISAFRYSHFGTPASNGPQQFADQGGYAIDFDTNIGLTNWWNENRTRKRRAPTYNINENATWIRGKLTMTFGGSYLRSSSREFEQVQVPGVNLGFNNTYDPARTLFTTANFPGASSAQLTDARELYGLLTGRVTAVTGRAALDAKTNKYVAFGPEVREGSLSVFGGFWQNSWKPLRTVTLTWGLRWDVQTPYKPGNDIASAVTLESICGRSGLGDGGLYSKCKFLTPGATGGAVPEFIQLKSGTQGYKTDWNNLAPSFGVAWRPNIRDGLLAKILGDPDQATLRAGWSVAFDRQGMEVFSLQYRDNPGSTLALNRDQNTGLVPAGQSWPVLFRERERLYVQSFPERPTYPIPVRPNRQDSLNGFAPDIQVGRAQTWSMGLQRPISRDMAVEVRYLGTFGTNQWSELNWNQIRGENLLPNKFLDEFKLAMANLAANNAAGGNRTGSFAYFGPGTGTNPLPIYLAYLNGRLEYTSPAAYTGTNWTNTTLAGRLSPANPAPVSAAGDLDGNASRRANAERLGYPANFFIHNPDVGAVNVYDSGAMTKYHAFQIEVRRRMSRGLYFNANYQYAVAKGSGFLGFSYGRTMVTNPNVRHAIKNQWGWTLPVGRGRRFGGNMGGFMNGVLGGWSLNGVGRVQARVLNFGEVRLVGMTAKELQEMYRYYFTTNPVSGLTEVWMLPEDVRLNTRRAYSVSSTTRTGYSTTLGPPEGRYIAPANSGGCIQVKRGDCGVPTSLLIRAPWFVRFDMGGTKRFRLSESKSIEVRFDLLNVLDNVNFYPVANPGTSATIFNVTAAYTDTTNTYDPGGRLGQIMLRFNW